MNKTEFSSPAEKCGCSFGLFSWSRIALESMVQDCCFQVSYLWKFLPGCFPRQCEAYNKQCWCTFWMKPKYLIVTSSLKCAEIICWIKTQKQFGMLFSWLIALMAMSPAKWLCCSGIWITFSHPSFHWGDWSAKVCFGSSVPTMECRRAWESLQWLGMGVMFIMRYFVKYFQYSEHQKRRFFKKVEGKSNVRKMHK